MRESINTERYRAYRMAQGPAETALLREASSRFVLSLEALTKPKGVRSADLADLLHEDPPERTTDQKVRDWGGYRPKVDPDGGVAAHRTTMSIDRLLRAMRGAHALYGWWDDNVLAVLDQVAPVDRAAIRLFREAVQGAVDASNAAGLRLELYLPPAKPASAEDRQLRAIRGPGVPAASAPAPATDALYAFRLQVEAVIALAPQLSLRPEQLLTEFGRFYRALVKVGERAQASPFSPRTPEEASILRETTGRFVASVEALVKPKGVASAQLADLMHEAPTAQTSEQKTRDWGAFRPKLDATGAIAEYRDSMSLGRLLCAMRAAHERYGWWDEAVIGLLDGLERAGPVDRAALRGSGQRPLPAADALARTLCMATAAFVESLDAFAKVRRIKTAELAPLLHTEPASQATDGWIKEWVAARPERDAAGNIVVAKRSVPVPVLLRACRAACARYGWWDDAVLDLIERVQPVDRAALRRVAAIGADLRAAASALDLTVPQLLRDIGHDAERG